MESGDYATIMRNNPFRSSKNTFYYYSCERVAEYIEAETSFHCIRCGEVHESLNLLRRHLNLAHRLQFWYFFRNLVRYVWTIDAASLENRGYSVMGNYRCI